MAGAFRHGVGIICRLNVKKETHNTALTRIVKSRGLAFGSGGGSDFDKRACKITLKLVHVRSMVNAVMVMGLFIWPNSCVVT